MTDPAALNEALWSSLRWADSSVEICRGDVEDPLAGAVRVTSGDEPPVDVIVGRSQWQAEVIARAEPVLLAGAMIPVARTADLILLKLFAGGPQDAWDIHQLLSADTSPELVRAVEGGLQALPASARALWERIGSERA